MHLFALLGTHGLVAASSTTNPNVTLNDTFLLVAVIGGFLTILGVLFGVYRAIRNSGIKDKQIDDMISAQPNAQDRAAQAVRNARLDQIMVKVAGDGTINNPGLDARFLAIDTRLLRIESAMSPNGLDTNRLGDMAKRTEIAVDKLQKGLEEHKRLSDETHLHMWTAIAGESPPKGKVG